MARTIPTGFNAIAPSELATTKEIDNTEQEIAQNGHFLYVNHRPTLIRNTFRSDVSASTGTQPYVVGRNPASVEVSALWNVEPIGDPFESVFIYALVANTSTTDDATLRFDLGTDPHPGTSVDINVPRLSGQWTTAIGTLDIDNTQTLETIRMFAINGASGQLQVHHVLILPKVPTSIPASVNALHGNVFVPIDDEETSQDAPLSVRLRTRQYRNLYHVWRNRPGMVLTFSEDTHFRAGSQAFTTTSTTYVEQIRVPVYVPREVTKIRWAVVGRKTGSSTGRVRLRTQSMDQTAQAAQVVDLPQTYAHPYTSNIVTYADGGQAALTCKPPSVNDFSQDELIVDLQSDGSASVDLIGITCWFEVP